MPYCLDDTIAAVATAPGGAARGVVRIAGPGTIGCLADCFDAADGAALSTRRWPTAILGAIQLEGLGRSLPCDLYLWPTARSYTRTPLAEIHTFGSPPLLSAVLSTICSRGARIAEPGEFTLRAFLGGRIDLAQAEAVLGVIDAAAAGQLQLALAQLAGGLSAPLDRLRESLLELLAELEAGLDFANEGIEFISPADLRSRLDEAIAAVGGITRQMANRGEVSAAPRAVLVGDPNVGKSSLFNALIAAFGVRPGTSPAALVSAEPGTTRDYLSARLLLGNLVCELIDTAGVESKSNESPADGAAESMTAEQRNRADLRLLCVDASRPLATTEIAALAAEATAASRLLVLTKCDLAVSRIAERSMLGRPGQRLSDSGALPQPPTSTALPDHPAPPLSAIETSAATGQGIERLGEALRAALIGAAAGGEHEACVASTVERCRESLASAAVSLDEARRLAMGVGGEEFIAAELRTALLEFGKITGAVYTDDILDRIFSRFCIGK